MKDKELREELIRAGILQEGLYHPHVQYWADPKRVEDLDHNLRRKLLSIEYKLHALMDLLEVKHIDSSQSILKKGDKEIAY